MTNPISLVQPAPLGLSQIQAPVQAQLEGVLEELRRIIVSDFDMMEEVNEYLLLMRGKLFRPTLLLLSSRVAGDTDNHAVTLGAVVELVHLATLVHDDAVDHSLLRRGMPTVNGLWTHQVAIIMGDYLYSRSVSELARLGELEAVRVLARAANEMSVGEMRQLTSYDALDFAEEDYFRLIAAKTASLMSAACEMGSLEGDDELRARLSSFGHDLGMAFQIADDLLDYTGSEDVIGKPSAHDLRERKVTLPLMGAMKRASDDQMQVIRDLFTTVDPSEGAIQDVVQLVHELEGIQYASEYADRYARRALEALHGLPESPVLGALCDSVAYVVGRSS